MAAAKLRVRRTTRSARATFALGERLGRLLGPGDAVALIGDLGSGKTELVRGVCGGAGVPASQVASPSFAIVATYQGRLPLHHADLYRIRDVDELAATGFFDLRGEEAALLVEWADRVPVSLPPDRLEIRMTHDARRVSVRHLEIVAAGERASRLARALAPRGAAARPGRREPGARRRPSAGK